MDLSIVVPVYGCESCLVALCERLNSVLSKLQKTYEIVLVDDVSKDNAWATIEKLAKNKANHVRGIQLSRNFGQHLAITAGLSEAKGDRVIVMDCDLQEPPEMIPEMLKAADKGYDIVYSVRKDRKDSFFRRKTATLYTKLVYLVSGQKINQQRSSFSVISRKVVDGFLKFGDCNRHYLYILNWMGFSSIDVEYEHQERFSGKSSYSFSKLIKHSLGGMFFHTNRFLYGIVFVGMGIALSGFLLAIYYIIRVLTFGAYPGWTSIAVLILCTSGFLGISIGVCGLYVGEIFEQVKGRPLFVIGKRTKDF